LTSSIGCQAQQCETIRVGDSSATGHSDSTTITRPPDSCAACIDSLAATDSTIAARTGGFIASYPNPATNQVSLDLKLSDDWTIYIHIFNSMGSEVQMATQAGYKGINHITLPVGGLR